MQQPELSRQQRIVLRSLADGGKEGRTNAWLSQYCCLNYGARIRELRTLGHDIEMDHGLKGLRTYRYVGFLAALQPPKEGAKVTEDWQDRKQGTHGLVIQYSASRKKWRVNRGAVTFDTEDVATRAMQAMQSSAAARCAAGTREANRSARRGEGES